MAPKSRMTAAEIAADLRHQIAAGVYKPGQKLPGVRELLDRYGPSKSAIDRVLRDLEAEGLVTVEHGRGIWVRRRHLVRRNLAAGLRLEKQRALAGMVPAEGLFEAATGADEVEVSAEYARMPAPPRVAEALGLEPGTEILRRCFRYSIAGAPHQVACSHLTLDLAEAAGLTGPEVEQPGTSTIAQLHAAGVEVDRVVVDLEARMPSEAERADLAIGPGDPVHEHWRFMYAGTEAVEVSTAVVPSSLVAYVIEVELGDGEL